MSPHTPTRKIDEYHANDSNNNTPSCGFGLSDSIKNENKNPRDIPPNKHIKNFMLKQTPVH